MDEHRSIPSEITRIYYPPPPWLLQGSALFATFGVPLERIEQLGTVLPEPLSLVSLPGRVAMGYLLINRYTFGSTLEYSELIAGLVVRRGYRLGPYILQAGVDNERAQRAWRDLWRLPRQLWHFAWNFSQPETSVQVWDGLRLVCTLSGIPQKTRLFPLSLTTSTYAQVGGQLVTLPSDLSVRVARTTWHLQVGPDGPLATLQPASHLVTFVVKGMVELQPPEIIVPD